MQFLQNAVFFKQLQNAPDFPLTFITTDTKELYTSILTIILKNAILRFYELCKF